jgi:hypothetical protein
MASAENGSPTFVLSFARTASGSIFLSPETLIFPTIPLVCTSPDFFGAGFVSRFAEAAFFDVRAAGSRTAVLGSFVPLCCAKAEETQTHEIMTAFASLY